jgi:hypothetical protein
VADAAADVVVARHDRDKARELAPAGAAWAPDLADGVMGPKITALRRLGLPAWLLGGDWFSADDEAVAALANRVKSSRDIAAQVLGIRPGKRDVRDLTVVRQLLALVGARLEVDRRRHGGGRTVAAAYRYRVVADPLPDGIAAEAVVAAWCERVGCVPKSPLQKEGATAVHGCG